MPYLHERRIYLNRRHSDNQFYTIVKVKGDPEYDGDLRDQD